MRLTSLVMIAIATGAAWGIGCTDGTASAQETRPGAGSPAEAEIDWRAEEAGVLANHVQLTDANDFVKAGEAYFSPDDSRIIFQAIAQPADDQTADEFYAMYVADIQRDPAGRITGLANTKRISPAGSANTCGWFHPTDPSIVIFGSTIGPPSESTPPGYQRASGRYRWMFPPEMNIVWCALDTADGTAASLEVLVHSDAYVAECSFTRDGRHLVYCSLETGEGDLFVLDVQTRQKIRIVDAPGYDGGPFFSPDDQRLCYRSDRKGDNLLQLFVADLAYDSAGRIVGVAKEHQLTSDRNVNWCPFWTRDGKHLVYATSEMGHRNYEVFIIDADPAANGRKRRLTHASGADVLPAFSSDGKAMMWTSQRAGGRVSQLWVADFVLE